MPGAAEDTLLHYPRIWPHLEHIEIVIGFKNQTIGATKMHFDKLRHVPEVSDDGHLCAIRTEREPDRISSVVRNRKSVYFNVSDCEMLARLDRFDPLEPLAKRLREDALHRIHGGFGNIDRRFPQSQHLLHALPSLGVFLRR